MAEQTSHGGANARSERRTLRRVLALAVPAAIVAVVLLPTNLSPVWRLHAVPASSMAPGYPVGSYLIVSRLSYGLARRSYDWFDLPISGRWPAWSPMRGDVGAFRLPRDPKVQYIKRIVGLPGDKVQMKAGRLWINGQIVPREDAGQTADPGGNAGRHVQSYTELLPGGASYRIVESEGDTGLLDNTVEFVVPAGHYFMLGDNRDNSSDSRMSGPNGGVGFVPAELLIGKVVFSF